MVAFAIAGLLTSSTLLLRLPFYAFPFFAISNALIFFLSSQIFGAAFFAGLVIVDIVYISFLLTVQSAYLARIYKNGMGRPLFVLDPRNTYPPYFVPQSKIKQSLSL